MKKERKVSFITTVLNEEKTIYGLLESILAQSVLPDEFIIVDGGSRDKTISKIQFQISNFKKKQILFRLIEKKGNRAVGRNEAIKHASGKILVCSDAGNILDKDWIKNITQPFRNKHVDVVAGYYKGLAKSIFQKCLIPYVLVMPDKVDPKHFLPATRSIAFKKEVWSRVGGFDEEFSHNEDYIFARKLKKIGSRIEFAHEAIVYWEPRRNFREAYTMFYRFALGDAQAGIYRPKVLLLFFRYMLGLILFIVTMILHNANFALILALAGGVYIVWAIAKNYMYINDFRAIGILPLLQFTADIAVIRGTIKGAWDTQKKL